MYAGNLGGELECKAVAEHLDLQHRFQRAVPVKLSARRHGLGL